MTEVTGKRTARMNEREFPHIVQVLVPPGGLGPTVHQIAHFHTQRGIQAMRGQYVRLDDRDFVRWCFADIKTAGAFVARFGGGVVVKQTKSWR